MVDWDDDISGFYCDPTRYLEALPELRSELPEGAFAFASDPAHYAISGTRCVKNLEIGSLAFSGSGRTDLEIRFAPNEWTHDAGLEIRYDDVESVEMRSSWITTASPPGLGGVLLDEVRPHAHGCVHDIALTNGSITVVCADLKARWE
ncbi:hypothetical protein DPM19_15825 [Actinomadura craniellae]|uniref:Uncharacterized protein n=1 Tax=Actinomadura craniellae TaxID=2231787 RepID=A0A365H5Q4_9ACTN|nr:hypothetical protein DPM19_15825 [Actinomadura craniellae]